VVLNTFVPDLPMLNPIGEGSVSMKTTRQIVVADPRGQPRDFPLVQAALDLLHRQMGIRRRHITAPPGRIVLGAKAHKPGFTNVTEMEPWDEVNRDGSHGLRRLGPAESRLVDNPAFNIRAP